MYAIGNGLARGTSFLLIPVYTHSLSMTDYGVLASLYITIEILVIMMNLGMRTTLVRFYAEAQKSTLVGCLIGTTTSVIVATGSVVAIIINIFLQPFFRAITRFQDVRTIMVLVCLSALIQTLSLHFVSYYRAKEEAQKFIVVSVSTAVLLALTITLMLIKFQLGITGALIAQILSHGTILLLVSIHILVRTGMNFSFAYCKELMRFGFPLVFSMLGQRSIGASAIYFLNIWGSLETVAIYALASRLAAIINMVVVLPFQMAFQPFVFSNLRNAQIRERIATLFQFLVLTTAVCGITVVIAGRVLVPMIAPPQYSLAYSILILLVPASAFSAASVLGEALIAIAKKTTIMALVFAGTGALSCSLGWVLISKFDLYGAVVALNLSHLLLGIAIVYWGLRTYPIPIGWQRVATTTAGFAFSLTMLWTFRGANSATFYGVIAFWGTGLGYALYRLGFLDTMRVRLIKGIFP